jgi:GAF domain-containing protein
MRGLRGEVYRSGRVAYDNRAGDWDETLLPGVSLPASNLLFAPLLIKGNVVGLLCIANKPDGFDGNDASLAEAFADLAALGLYNTLLLELVKTSEQRLRAVVETAGGTATADVQGLIVSWNQAVAAIFGGSADHVIEPSAEKKGR